MELRVLTIGHSIHPPAEFVSLLQAHGIERLVDVRSVPRSRHNPQFNSSTLMRTLAAEGIAYTHLPGLGGLRKPLPNSVNGAWDNDSFRGYADYMQTPEFSSNLTRLMDLAARGTTAVMCAESLPWRCHRLLIADALTVRGVMVEHIMTPVKRQPHQLSHYAHVVGTVVTYPPGQPELF